MLLGVESEEKIFFFQLQAKLTRQYENIPTLCKRTFNKFLDSSSAELTSNSMLCSVRRCAQGGNEVAHLLFCASEKEKCIRGEEERKKFQSEKEKA